MPTLAEITKAFVISTLEKHLQSLVGPRDPYLGSGRRQLTQQYLKTELAQWGTLMSQPLQAPAFSTSQPDTRETSANASSDRFCNYTITLPGQQPELEPILVGAHYDTVPNSPGADDNASGVAVLLVLAELLSQSPPKRSIQLVAFDLEEYGLIGSRTCAQELRSQNQPLHLMISLEMLGYFTQAPNSQSYPLQALKYLYPSTGNFIAMIGNLSTLPKMMSLKRNFKAADASCQWLPVVNGGKQIPRVRDSDHSPFWDAGYPAIMLTDTANLRSPHYHAASDTLDTLDIDMMAKVTRGLAIGLSQL